MSWEPCLFHTQHAATSVNDTKRASRDFDGALRELLPRRGHARAKWALDVDPAAAALAPGAGLPRGHRSASSGRTQPRRAIDHLATPTAPVCCTAPGRRADPAATATLAARSRPHLGSKPLGCLPHASTTRHRVNSTSLLSVLVDN